MSSKSFSIVIDPARDGIDHINIYSKGATQFGRALSNFALTPFSYPPYGEFASVEGFWYWYLTGECHEELRALSGFKAKQSGRGYERLPLTEERKEVLLEAIRCKLRQHEWIRNLLAESTLPLTHYYNYSGKVIELLQYDWITKEIERIRGLIKQKNGHFTSHYMQLEFIVWVVVYLYCL